MPRILIQPYSLCIHAKQVMATAVIIVSTWCIIHEYCRLHPLPLPQNLKYTSAVIVNNPMGTVARYGINKASEVPL